MAILENRLKGILPPLTTPFDERGEVDYVALADNVARYNDTGLAGYVALGSNSEVVHLTADERVRVIETIKLASERGAQPPGDAALGDQESGRVVVAGINEFSTRAAIEAVRRAAGAGADAVLVITPYFYKGAMTEDVFIRHFTAVADASPVPVLLYNVPQNTGVVIEPSTVATLSAHPNIRGIKDSAGNMGAISSIIRLARKDFAVLTGNGGILYPSLLMGAAGAVLAIACAAPGPCVDLFNAAASGDQAGARELQHRVSPVSQVVTTGFGVAGLKAAMTLAGFNGGLPRAPLAAVSDPERETIRTIMRASGLFPGLE
jgi:4-hydroxy-2-oxoglutarate aldolase